jgi:hypothetical protein
MKSFNWCGLVLALVVSVLATPVFRLDHEVEVVETASAEAVQYFYLRANW